MLSNETLKVITFKTIHNMFKASFADYVRLLITIVTLRKLTRLYCKIENR